MDKFDPSIAFFPDTCIAPKSGNKSPPGYFTFWITKGQNERAHRLSYRMFIGSIPIDMGVIHTCNNKACINPKHLILGTAVDVAKKTAKHFRGEKKPNAKLTPDIVRFIRESDMTRKELAKKFGVWTTCITKVITGKSWKHVKPKPD